MCYNIDSNPRQFASLYIYFLKVGDYMSRNTELDALKLQEQEAFQRKQEAYGRYQVAKNRANIAYDAMQTAWAERCRAREEMNSEYEALQKANALSREIWDEYGRIRDRNNSRMEALRHEANSEHKMMIDCFDRASHAYNNGNKADAPKYAAEGHEHKAKRDALNAQINALVQEIQSAKATAKWKTSRFDGFAFRRAKDIFMQAKARHESAQFGFRRLKAEQDARKKEFDAAHAEHLRLRGLFQKKLEEVKAEQHRKKYA